MVDANFQREVILPSEKAFAYKMKLGAIKRKTDAENKISNPNSRAPYSIEVLAEESDDSRHQIQRYIRLTKLCPELLNYVDEKYMPFNAAVDISYLSENEQAMLCEVITQEECTPNLSQAQRLKKHSQDGTLDFNIMSEIMSEANCVEQKLTIKGEILSNYFDKNVTPKERLKIIVKLLESWKKKLERNQA